jgi:hypothetical protein
MTIDRHEFAEFAPRARFHTLELSGSVGHPEEPTAGFEELRNFRV